MQLGVVVTDARFADPVTALLQAAAKRGWRTRCFLTDNGVLLLQAPAFIALVRNGQAQVALCELSVERYGEGLDLADLSDKLVIGGQYQDAELVRHSDKVLVF